jgi:hypothetical protein
MIFPVRSDRERAELQHDRFFCSEPRTSVRAVSPDSKRVKSCRPGHRPGGYAHFRMNGVSGTHPTRCRERQKPSTLAIFKSNQVSCVRIIEHAAGERTGGV